MKILFLSLTFFSLTSLAFAKDYQWEEAQIRSQLTTDDVQVLSIKRDYFEMVTYILYIYRVADGEHDYKVKLRVENNIYKCNATYYLSQHVLNLGICYGGETRLDDYMKDDVDFVKIKMKH